MNNFLDVLKDVLEVGHLECEHWFPSHLPCPYCESQPSPSYETYPPDSAEYLGMPLCWKHPSWEMNDYFLYVNPKNETTATKLLDQHLGKSLPLIMNEFHDGKLTPLGLKLLMELGN